MTTMVILQAEHEVFIKFQPMFIVAIHCYRWQEGESIPKIIIVLNNKTEPLFLPSCH